MPRYVSETETTIWVGTGTDWACQVSLDDAVQWPVPDGGWPWSLPSCRVAGDRVREIRSRTAATRRTAATQRCSHGAHAYP
ncbi:MAG TPA: hypothetical protein VF060_14310 [Trebonia sp.]